MKLKAKRKKVPSAGDVKLSRSQKTSKYSSNIDESDKNKSVCTANDDDSTKTASGKVSAKGCPKTSQTLRLKPPPATSSETFPDLFSTDTSNVPNFLHDPFRSIPLSTSPNLVRALS
jgi:hypothetical protein